MSISILSLTIRQMTNQTNQTTLNPERVEIKNHTITNMIDNNKKAQKKLIISSEYIIEKRKNLLQNLLSLRSQGEIGRYLAKDLYDQESKSDRHTNSKKSYEQIINELNGIVKDGESFNLDLFGSNVDNLLQTIFDYRAQNSEPYSEKDLSLIIKILNSYMFAFDGNRYELRGTILNLLSKFIDILPIEKQEEYIIKTIKATYFIKRRYVYVVKGGRVQTGYDPATYDNFKCIKSYSKTGHLSDTDDLYSCEYIISPLMKKILAKTKNPEFINTMIILLITYGFDIKDFITGELSEEYLTETNIFHIINKEKIITSKAYLGEILLSLHDNCVQFSSESISHCVSVMKELKSNKIPLIREKSVFIDNGTPIKDVYSLIGQKNDEEDFFSKIYIDGKIDKSLLKKAKEIYSSSKIWDGLGNNFFKAEFINMHIEDLSDILDNDGIAHILRNIVISDDGKKLDSKVLDKFDIFSLVRYDPSMSRYEGYTFSIEAIRRQINTHTEMAKLIAQKVDFQKVPKCIAGYAIYDAMSNKGMLDKEHIALFSPYELISYYEKNMKSIYNTAGTPLDYYGHKNYQEQARSILEYRVVPVIKKHLPGYIDNVLISNDKDKLREMVYFSGYLFKESMSDSQIKLLIDNVINNTITEEDLKGIKYLCENFNGSTIIYLSYFLYGTLPEIKCPHLNSQTGKYEYYDGGRYIKTDDNFYFTDGIPETIYKHMMQKQLFKGFPILPKIAKDPFIPNLNNIISMFGKK